MYSEENLDNMTSIDINLSEYLNIDYIKEQTDLKENITINTDNNSYNDYVVTTKQQIFKPKETGSYTVEYNNKQLSVNVYKKVNHLLNQTVFGEVGIQIRRLLVLIQINIL